MSEYRETLERIEELLNKGKRKQLDEQGREILDPRPVAPPLGYIKQPSMVENIRAMIRSESLRHHAESEGIDTFEEAEDFDTGEDDDDPRTPYEAVFDPPAIPLPGELSEPAPEPPEPRRDAPEAQGTQPEAGESEPALPLRPAAGSKTPPNPPKPPNTPRKA